MHKVCLFMVAMFLWFSAPASAENERYQYNVEDKLVFDSATGKVYRFLRDGNDTKHVIVDYVNGLVKVNGVIKASGSFDYRDVEEEVIYANV